MSLHLHLKHIVVVDFVGLQVWKCRVFDNDSRRHVFQDVVVLNQRCRVLFCQDTCGVVINDLVVLYYSFRVDQHKPVEVVVYRVLLDNQRRFALNHEHPF